MGIHTILLILAGVSMIASVVGSFAALVMYLRRDDASLFGFGFHRYYYGEMRRSHPRVFLASLGGAVLAIALVVVASLFKDGG